MEISINNETKTESKGQKILAAVYLVTNHFSDTDPLRLRLRAQALALAVASPEEREALACEIITLLEAATLARLISENNTSLLIAEIRYFAFSTFRGSDTLRAMFASDKGQEIKRTSSSTLVSKPMSFNASPVPKKSADIKDERAKRQSRIVAFINQKKSASIKDITALFPSVSEKTIQRELSVLVSSGKITKRGSKRWSVYLAAV